MYPGFASFCWGPLAAVQRPLTEWELYPGAGGPVAAPQPAPDTSPGEGTSGAGSCGRSGAPPPAYPGTVPGRSRGPSPEEVRAAKWGSEILQREREAARESEMLEKHNRRAADAAVKYIRPEECLKYMRVCVDPAILEDTGGYILLDVLNSLGSEYSIEPQSVPSTITWRREFPEVMLADLSEEIKNMYKSKEENQVLVLLSPNYFLKMVWSHKQILPDLLSVSTLFLCQRMWSVSAVFVSFSRLASSFCFPLSLSPSHFLSNGQCCMMRQSVLGPRASSDAGSAFGAEKMKGIFTENICETFDSFIMRILDKQLHRAATLAVIGLDTYTREKGLYSPVKRPKNSESNRIEDSESWVSLELGLTCADLDEVQVALQLQTHTTVWFLDDWQQFADHVATLTKAIARCPFKKQTEKMTFSFCPDGTWSTGVKVDKDGKGLLKLWKKQLQQLNRITQPVAMAIAQAYPTPKLLLRVKALNDLQKKKPKSRLKKILEVRRYFIQKGHFGQHPALLVNLSSQVNNPQ
ncbi:structure-specific endonuclease subunit EME2-like [Mustelus asterias]